jgi:hypothetical protein
MKNWTKELILVVGVCLSIGSAGTPLQAEDRDVNINLNAPPGAVAVPPTMLFLDKPAVYVAVGIPYDIFFTGGRYYFFYTGNWYWGPGYKGPWTHVKFRSLPPSLRKYKILQLRAFREREFKAYKDQGPRYKGRMFVGVEAPATPRNEPMKDSHMKEGMGRGRGPKR